MNDDAFNILGISPTKDGRVIRAAFLRLARIYHPDRFAGMAEDVREEAERRMKEATRAYESLRSVKPEDRVEIPEAEIQKRAHEYRQSLQARHAEETRDRERWRRWERIESEARQRAEADAEIAAAIAREVGIVVNDGSNARVAEAVPESAPYKSGSLLRERLDAAYRGETAPLARSKKD